MVLGVVGLVAGNRVLGLNSDPIEDLIHLVVGALLAYAAFKGTDAQAASWSKIFGVIFVVVGIVGFLSKTMFGLLPGGLGPVDNIVHLIYGGVGFWAGRAYKAS